MMEVRATLSVMMLKNSAPLLTREDFDKLEEIVKEQRGTSDEDIVRSEELNYKFHDILTSRAENSMASLLLELVHANIDRYLRELLRHVADEGCFDRPARGDRAGLPRGRL